MKWISRMLWRLLRREIICSRTVGMGLISRRAILWKITELRRTIVRMIWSRCELAGCSLLFIRGVVRYISLQINKCDIKLRRHRTVFQAKLNPPLNMSLALFRYRNTRKESDKGPTSKTGSQAKLHLQAPSTKRRHCKCLFRRQKSILRFSCRTSWYPDLDLPKLKKRGDAGAKTLRIRFRLRSESFISLYLL